MRVQGIARRLREVGRSAELALDLAAARIRRADLALFHQFPPPPSGGGNQFLRALLGELRRRGLRVEQDRISHATPACLFNSFNFDFARLRRFARAGCRMVHRVDGPILAYRGFDDGTDERIVEINHELAQATVFQSRYSLEAHRALGLELAAPVIIPNAVDPAIFHPPPDRPARRGPRVRLISTSWSDNPNKGAATYAWLDRNLDFGRFEYTFVGRSPVPFERVRLVSPVGSHELARLLREHDVYLAASLNDPCSNALLEALACGLPALYADSGGHPELVGEAGLGFASTEELLARLERLVEEYDERRASIVTPSLAQVAERYLEALGLGGRQREGAR